MTTLTSLLHKDIENIVQKRLNEFLQSISTEFDIELSKLEKLAGAEVKKERSEFATVDMDDISPARLATANKTELAALCKARKLACSGTKAVLIDRLLGNTSKPASEKVLKKETKKKKSPDKPVLKAIENKVKPINLSKFGSNFIHAPTRLVFDGKSKTVVGKADNDDRVEDLTDEDIEICNQYGFPYTLPKNLDKNSKIKIDKINVEKLDSDIEADSGEDVEDSGEDLEETDEEELEEED